MVDNKEYKIFGILGVGALILAFILVPINNSQSTHATDVSTDNPPIFINSFNNVTPCTYTVYQDKPIVNNNYTYYGANCVNGSIIVSSMNASLVFNTLSTNCNTNNGCSIHVQGYSNSNFFRAYNITKAIQLPESGHYNLVGEGTEFTVLKIPSGYDNNMFEYAGNHTNHIAYFNYFGNFQMVGNVAGSNNRGFYINSTSGEFIDSVWYNLFLRDFKTDDIYLGSLATGINNCWNNKFDDMTIELAGRAGLYIDGNANCQDWKVTESKFLYNNQFGIFTNGQYGNIMESFFYKTNQTSIKNNGGAGLIVTNNKFLDDGIQTTNTYYEIWNLGSSNIFSNNKFAGADTGLNKPKYGIFMDTFENGNVVIGNVFTSGSRFGTASIFAGTTSQTNNLIMNNGGFNPVGKVSNPFFTTGNTIIVSGGGSATPNNATVTTNVNTPIYMTITGGTTVSIELQDNNGNVIQTGLTTITQQEIPFGYKIKVTWHTVPTFTVYAQ